MFTPAEANRTLPLVRRIVADVLEAGRALRELAADPAVDADDARVAELQARLGDLGGELDQIGCQYKDWGFEMGLIDFPGEIDGRPVLLCWRSDEEAVGWYHPAETGFAGRRPIPEALLIDEG